MQTVQTAPIVLQLKYALKANASRNVYIGSGEKATGRPRSPLAMPYELRQLNWKDDAERDEKIAAYKVWLWRIMRNPQDPRHDAVWNELRKLRADSILLCYCYPRNCHGHVIVAAWKWGVANGKIDAPRQEPPLKQPTVPAAQTEERMMADARRNQKELSAEDKAELDRRFPDKPAAVIAPGPLDMPAVMARLHKDYTALADASLDEEILAEHVTTCPDCDEPTYIYENNANNTEDTLMEDDVPYPIEKTMRGDDVPRKKPRKGIVYSVTDPYYNEYDDVTADLTDMYTFDAAFDRESIALAS